MQLVGCASHQPPGSTGKVILIQTTAYIATTKTGQNTAGPQFLLPSRLHASAMSGTGLERRSA